MRSKIGTCCLLVGFSLFSVCMCRAVFADEFEPILEKCFRTNVAGVKQCNMNANDPCPPAAPTCGKALGGDGCTCK